LKLVGDTQGMEEGRTGASWAKPTRPGNATEGTGPTRTAEPDFAHHQKGHEADGLDAPAW
jgi:hypothetical protein